MFSGPWPPLDLDQLVVRPPAGHGGVVGYGRPELEGGWARRQPEAVAFLGQEPKENRPERAVEAIRIFMDEPRGEGPAEAAEVVAEKAAGRALDRREPPLGPFLVLARIQGAQGERLLARQEVHELALTGDMIHALVPALGRLEAKGQVAAGDVRQLLRLAESTFGTVLGLERADEATAVAEEPGVGHKAVGRRGGAVAERLYRRPQRLPGRTTSVQEHGGFANRAPPGRAAEGAGRTLDRWAETEGEGVIEHAPREGLVDRGVDAGGVCQREVVHQRS